MNCFWWGIVGCLFLTGTLLRAQSPVVQPGLTLKPPRMLAPMETTPVPQRESTGYETSAPRTPGLGYCFELVDYFDGELSDTNDGPWNRPKLSDELLTNERLAELTRLDTSRNANPLQLPQPFPGGLQPLVASNIDSGQPQLRYSEPQRDAQTSPLPPSDAVNARNSATNQRPAGETIATENTQIILDPAVQTVAFQEPAAADQAKKPDSTQDGKSAEQEPEPKPEQDGQTSPLVVNELSIEGLRKKVQDQIELVKSNETLDENSKQEQLKQLNSASALVQKAATLQATIDQETKKKDGFQKDFEAREDRLAESLEPESPKTVPGPDQTQEQLQVKLQLELEEKRQSYQVKKSERDLIETQLEKRDKRIGELPSMRTVVQEQQRVIKEQMAALKSQPDDLASSLILSAKELAALKELDLIDTESSRQGQIGTLLPMERTLVLKEITKLEEEIAAWEAAYNALRAEEINNQKENAQNARNEAIKADSALADLAVGNQTLSEERSNLAEKKKTCRGRQAETEARSKEIDASLDNIKGKIETPGRMTKENGIELVELRRRLIETFESQSLIQEIDQDNRESRLKGLRLKEERQSLAKRDELIAELVKKRNTRKPAQTDTQLSLPKFKEMADELISTKLDYLKKLEDDLKEYRNCRIKEREGLLQLVNKVREVRQYIDKNALWIRSANPVSREDLDQSKKAIVSFFEPAQWRKLAQYARAKMAKRPYESALAGFVMLGMFFVSRRLRGNA